MLERFKNYRPQAATKKIIDRANRIIAEYLDQGFGRVGSPGQAVATPCYLVRALRRLQRRLFRLIGQPRLALPPCMIEPTNRAARARGYVGDLLQAVFVGLDAGGNRLSRVWAPDHERGHVNLPSWGSPRSGNFG